MFARAIHRRRTVDVRVFVRNFETYRMYVVGKDIRSINSVVRYLADEKKSPRSKVVVIYINIRSLIIVIFAHLFPRIIKLPYKVSLKRFIGEFVQVLPVC